MREYERALNIYLPLIVLRAVPEVLRVRVLELCLALNR